MTDWKATSKPDTMPAMTRSLSAMAACAAAFTLASALAITPACQRADSTLLIAVTSIAPLAPASLEATVAADTRRWNGGAAGDPIALPTGLEVVLPRDVVGPVTVTVDAYDSDQGLLATGTSVQAHIDAGGDTTIVVTLGDDAMEGSEP